jgi:ATP-dependent Lon protease
MFIVAMQKPGRSRETPFGVAGLGLIRVSVDHADGTSHLILQGLTRVELRSTVRYKPYRVQSIRPLRSGLADNVIIDALQAKVLELVRQRLEAGPSPMPFPILQGDANAGASALGSQITVDDLLRYLEGLSSADQVADMVSCAFLADPKARQLLLETVDLERRLKHLIHFLMAELSRCRNNKGP